MSLLRPLLLDAVPTIQQTAALALERLAKYNDGLAEAVVKGDVLPWPVYPLAEQNARLQMSLLGTGLLTAKSLSELRRPSPCGADLSGLVDSGALDALVTSLEEKDPELPQMVVSAGGAAAVIDYLWDSKRNACCLGLRCYRPLWLHSL
ncbi:hypothetical protein AOLI_G00261550 [Acnodon oligacanthus]